MAYGYQRLDRIYLGDTQTARAHLYEDDDETLVPQNRITSVLFTILRPGETLASPPAVNGAAGTVTGNGEAIFVVPTSVHTLAGNYKGRAVFAYTDSAGRAQTRSVPIEYDVVDPFEATGLTPADPAIDDAWKWFDDLFDSEGGGPWLRDMSLAHFDKDKLKTFVPDVLLEINATMPQTNYTIDSFPYGENDGKAIMTLGVVLANIRHLMRSYTEQPDAANSPVAHHSRRDYIQRWGSIYQVEKERWEKLLPLFKARGFDINRASILLGTKAGRTLPGTMRTRSVGRGYY